MLESEGRPNELSGDDDDKDEEIDRRAITKNNIRRSDIPEV